MQLFMWTDFTTNTSTSLVKATKITNIKKDLRKLSKAADSLSTTGGKNDNEPSTYYVAGGIALLVIICKFNFHFVMTAQGII